MANVGLTVTLNQSLSASDGKFSSSVGAIKDVNGTAPDYTAVAADIATLVADGATPTQAHVTTLNTDWGTYKAAADAYTGAVGGLTANATFYFDPSVVNSMRKARAILRQLEHTLAGRLGE